MLLLLALVACEKAATTPPVDTVVDTDAPVATDTFPDPVPDPGPPPPPATLSTLAEVQAAWGGGRVFDLKVTAWTLTNPWLFAEAWQGWQPELVTTVDPAVGGCGVIAHAADRAGAQIDLAKGTLTPVGGAGFEVPVKNCAAGDGGDCQGKIWQVDYGTVGARGEAGAIYGLGQEDGDFAAFSVAELYRLPPEPFRLGATTLRTDGGLDVAVEGLAGGSFGMIVHGSDPQPQLWCDFGTSSTGTLPASVAAAIADNGAWRVQVVRTERFAADAGAGAGVVVTVEAWDEAWLER